ncbi:hypothetical protein GCM10023350_31190 [Nocardioides endophyticus]|uniref:DinB-like domain-containing protein n=1 Tax=Nocardioides endophyticus TaxID=1353775 RepID=A0ABP8Z203_9ACTN
MAQHGRNLSGLCRPIAKSASIAVVTLDAGSARPTAMWQADPLAEGIAAATDPEQSVPALPDQLTEEPAWLDRDRLVRAVPDSGDDGAMTTYSDTLEFEGATFVKASFEGATLRFSDVSGVTMRGVDVAGLDIDSHDLSFGSLFVNGVDVVPLVEAELNRRFPGRELQKAHTPEGLREGWVAVQSAWQETAAGTPADLVDAHVEDEWSLSQTLRHLILATDAWLRGGIMRIQQPFHEIGQIFTGADEMGFDMSIFRAEPPAYEEVLAVRAERQRMVTDFLATATVELLAEEREDPWGGGDWRPSVGDCMRVILEEEWAHLRYIRRDLARMR